MKSNFADLSVRKSGLKTRFKSGYFTWRIHWSEEHVSDTFGKTDELHKVITIYKQENKQIERETLFHELLHAVGEDKYDAIFGFEQHQKELDREENLIRLLSPALMQVLSDNKGLARYLFNIA